MCSMWFSGPRLILPSLKQLKLSSSMRRQDCSSYRPSSGQRFALELNKWRRGIWCWWVTINSRLVVRIWLYHVRMYAWTNWDPRLARDKFSKSCEPIDLQIITPWVRKLFMSLWGKLVGQLLSTRYQEHLNSKMNRPPRYKRVISNTSQLWYRVTRYDISVACESE